MINRTISRKIFLFTSLLTGLIMTSLAANPEDATHKISNPGFENGTYEVTVTANPSYVPNGWTYTFGSAGTEVIRVASATDEIFNQTGKYYTPVDGDYFVYLRASWNQPVLSLNQAIADLVPGNYKLTLKTNSSANASTVGTVSVKEGLFDAYTANAVINTEYDLPWETLELPFKIIRGEDVVLTIALADMGANNGTNKVFLIDDIQLEFLGSGLNALVAEKNNLLAIALAINPDDIPNGVDAVLLAAIAAGEAASDEAEAQLQDAIETLTNAMTLVSEALAPYAALKEAIDAANLFASETPDYKGRDEFLAAIALAEAIRDGEATQTNDLGPALSNLLRATAEYELANEQEEGIPLVYRVENTGVGFGKPLLPTFNQLPVVLPLTDPFMWSATDPHSWTDAAAARSTKFSDWSKRRSEIAWEIQHYEIGEKPVVARENVTATFSGTQLTVTVTNPANGQTLTITATVVLPAGPGPFPAIIGMNSGTGSLPAAIFTTRNVARITFSHNQVTTYNNHRNSDPFYRLYPQFNVDNHGQYAAWAWGVSRIIDGLEICQETLPINLNHIGVTGCSYAGKMALFAGAFDERIALTIAQESGGGGVPAWRVSETLGDVEKLGATDRNWFKNDMFTFSGTNTARLPHDHHELAAMIAPRALFHIGNPNYIWLADQSGYVSIMAAREVYKTFGIEDRIGFTIMGGHNHCQLPTGMYPEIEAFVDKFLLGKMDVNTVRMRSIYENVDHQRWINWWGTNKPEFPTPASGSYEYHWFEAERFVTETQGSDFLMVNSALASNGKYITVKPGTQAISSAPTTAAGLITIPFTITEPGVYNIFARINCASFDDDSFWLRVNNGSFTMLNGLSTSGAWLWNNFLSAHFTAGQHSITIGYREDGAFLDKICITNYPFAPEGMGEPDPLVSVAFEGLSKGAGYSLHQNFPNPANEITRFTFEIPAQQYVSLKVYNLLGMEIAQIAGKVFAPGKHILEFDTQELSRGIYIYTLTAGDISLSRKMTLK